MDNHFRADHYEFTAREGVGERFVRTQLEKTPRLYRIYEANERLFSEAAKISFLGHESYLLEVCSI